MGKNYPRLELVDFGRQLFSSRDLDPVYPALLAIRSNRAWGSFCQWLLAYWLFYDAGFACWASDLPATKYWDKLAEAAANRTVAPLVPKGPWPRGSERRHFRGELARSTVHWLRTVYVRPVRVVEYLMGFGAGASVQSVVDRAASLRGFGPWISFKVADMLDMLGMDLDQSEVAPFLYDNPLQAIWKHYEAGTFPFTAAESQRSAIPEKALDWLAGQLSDLEIPHKPGTPPDRFCVETVFCKHKAHLSGHYPLLKDTRELSHSVAHWASINGTARMFLQALPSLPAGNALY